MSWTEYVRRIAPDRSQGEIAAAAGVTGPTVSRWMSEKQGVDPSAAAEFARTFNRPVLEAFVAAGFLTEQEAKVRPSAAPDFTKLTNDELLELVRTRMTEEVTGNAEHPAAKTKRHLAPAASGGATPEEADEASTAGANARAKQDEARAAMRDRKK